MKDPVDMGVGDVERGFPSDWERCSTDDCLPASPPEVTAPPKAKSRWRKVKRAQAWRPKDGEEGAFYVSGVVILDLVNAANLTNEDIIKVVFLRAEENEATGHTCKIFELYKLEEDK